MNDCKFTGRLTKDIELRYTPNDGKAVGNFSLAVDSGYKDYKRTDFLNFAVFGKRAESMEKYVKKGMKILVHTEAKQNQYTDKNGNKVNGVQFIVNDFEFCESKSANSGSAPAHDLDIPPEFGEESDVPF